MSEQKDDRYNDIPMIPIGLPESLERFFSERWPTLEWTDKQISHRAGCLDTLRLLYHIQKHQLNEAGKTSVTRNVHSDEPTSTNIIDFPRR